MRKWLRKITITIALMLLAAIAACWLWLPSASTIDRESYAAMSAFLNRPPAHNDQEFLKQHGTFIIYNRTSNGIFRLLPPTWSRFNTPMMRIEALLRSITSHHLEQKFSTSRPVLFTSDPTIEEADLTPAQQDSGYGTITFSKVTFNHDATHAIFYTEHLCGLCGEGRFVAMEKQNGQWIVVDELYTWVS
jgi:hypothetical protein